LNRVIKPLYLKILLSLGSLVFLFSVAEVAVRVLGERDASGNFYFKNRIIHPHRLPVEMVSERIRALEEADDSLVTYHEVLGWAPRPGAVSADGLYSYNSQGIRTPVPAYAAKPPEGVLRIALFGDSFTHGDDVPYEHSWGAVLERLLNETGRPAEVLNFGVGGYGIDQALLRFQQQGAAFAPQVVVLGFQPENLKRNLNLLRPLYDPRSGLPFAKPRFILSDRGINLINVPVLPPDRMVATIQDFDAWELRPHEYFYNPADFHGSWWQRSKLLATAYDLKVNREDRWLLKRIIFREKSEEQGLGWAIIQAFDMEVTAMGARFMIVHLPSNQEMKLRAGLGRWTYQTFLDALDGAYDVVHPENTLMKAAQKGGLEEIFAGHYNEKGNRIIAREILDHLDE
jgi:hypothetical protein